MLPAALLVQHQQQEGQIGFAPLRSTKSRGVGSRCKVNHLLSESSEHLSGWHHFQSTQLDHLNGVRLPSKNAVRLNIPKKEVNTKMLAEKFVCFVHFCLNLQKVFSFSKVTFSFIHTGVNYIPAVFFSLPLCLNSNGKGPSVLKCSNK